MMKNDFSEDLVAFHATRQCRNSSIAPSIAVNRRGSTTRRLFHENNEE